MRRIAPREQILKWHVRRVSSAMSTPSEPPRRLRSTRSSKNAFDKIDSTMTVDVSHSTKAYFAALTTSEARRLTSRSAPSCV